MRRITLATALALFALPAFAQNNSAPVAATTPAAPSATSTTTTQTTPTADGAATTQTTTTRTHMTMQQRFEAANTTHDGHLTKEQAEAGHMRGVTRHFDEIDTDKKGYVTLDQIKSYSKAKRAAHKAAKQKTAG